jgi:hypothetical protein
MKFPYASDSPEAPLGAPLDSMAGDSMGISVRRQGVLIDAVTITRQVGNTIDDELCRNNHGLA